jgi:hypothetical protein
LSRRLGDDPLTRARAGRAKAAEGSATVAGSGGQEGTAQVGIQTSSRASFNDVFFQRRGDAVAPPQATAETGGAPEVPEISEISELPEIRDAAATSGSLAPFDVTAAAEAASSAPQVAQAQPASITEEVVARLNAAAPSQAKEEPSPATASQLPANGSDEPIPEPQKGGFFKRLFGKFK